jgi:hypothetical protein
VEIGMSRRVALSLAILAAATLGSAGARAEIRGVIELFTSQGCSSCPDADKLAGELARDPSLVVLTLPIDIWDYLGWKDTLAKPRHTARQRGYAHGRGDREVYTPQVVVNGKKHVVGSDRNAIEQAIAATRGRNNILMLPVKLVPSGDKVTVSIPAAAGLSGEVWLCPIAKAIPVAIGRGENHGRTVTYHNVVRRWVKLGEWNGTARTFTVPAADFAGDSIDTVAVVVQGGTADSPGTMLGAAIASLH